jgi:hypothetical protein
MTERAGAQPGHGWRDRFTASWVSFPSWSPAAPDRLFFVSADDGTTQGWWQDLATGRRHRLTSQAVGVEQVVPVPDGSGAAWWRDDVGDQHGSWVVTAVSDGSTHTLLPGLPPGWSEGLSMAAGTVAVGLADESSYRVYVAADGGPGRLVYQSDSPSGVGRAWETSAPRPSSARWSMTA